MLHGVSYFVLVCTTLGLRGWLGQYNDCAAGWMTELIGARFVTKTKRFLFATAPYRLIGSPGVLVFPS